MRSCHGRRSLTTSHQAILSFNQSQQRYLGHHRAAVRYQNGLRGLWIVLTWRALSFPQGEICLHLPSFVWRPVQPSTGLPYSSVLPGEKIANRVEKALFPVLWGQCLALIRTGGRARSDPQRRPVCSGGTGPRRWLRRDRSWVHIARVHVARASWLTHGRVRTWQRPLTILRLWRWSLADRWNLPARP